MTNFDCVRLYNIMCILPKDNKRFDNYVKILKNINKLRDIVEKLQITKDFMFDKIATDEEKEVIEALQMHSFAVSNKVKEKILTNEQLISYSEIEKSLKRKIDLAINTMYEDEPNVNITLSKISESYFSNIVLQVEQNADIKSGDLAILYEFIVEHND